MTSCASAGTFLRLLSLAAILSLGLAGPRYIAIPIDGVDVIELNPLSPVPRLPRHTEAYVSALQQQQQQQQQQSAPAEPVFETVQARPERAVAAHILDYVDFGAHTGPNGAFTWYADYPSHH